MKVLVIGAGNMGLTYAEGMANSLLLSKHRIRIFDTEPKKLKPYETILDLTCIILWKNVCQKQTLYL